VALFGAAAAGCSYAPINYRLPVAALVELAERLDPAVVVSTRENRAALAQGTGAGSGAVVQDAGGWLADLGSRPAEPFAFADAPEAPAVVLYTSGTSSAPKAAVLRHDQLLSYVFNSLEFGAAGDDEATLLAVPPFHVAGVAAVLSSCYVGRRLVGLPRFSAESWLGTAARERVTHAFVVPTMLARIVAAMDADPRLRVPTLRHLAYGGARMPLPVLERALELFPDTDFVNAYGLTETSSTVAVLGPADHRAAAAAPGDQPALRARLSSAGRPLPGIEVQVIDDDGASVAAGVPGEICLRGDQVGGAYLDAGSRLDGDGWLRTGDQGWVDGDGYLFVTGRSDDMIISGGENIAPAEIEDALLRHPAVAAVAVVGISDDEWGERVGAMVVPSDAVTLVEADLTAWARERLGSLKAPKVLLVRAELPTTATGKILKRAIRAEFEPPTS
ncbi:MAG TPA: long-chain fatty acid--CoA ligase, partial [Acidimicrobiales bacterium]|jgi:acyl-CoA synthetase (AMP-forming)/AMP-acid ligase II|nr:long-chain fatty acid--CoA ligase [Acidimicrobiales bacterium]